MVIKRIVLASLAALGLVLAVTVPARATTGVIENIGSTLFVTSQGHNAPVVIGNGSTFTSQSCSSWDGHTVCLWSTGGLCLDASPSNGLVYMETCSRTNAYEQFWTPGVGVGTNWFINAGWTNSAHQNAYMTQVQPVRGSQVAANYGPGFGNAAVWAAG